MLRPEEIVEYYYAEGYEIIIITDHNEIEGALIARNYAEETYPGKIEVVIGEEIKTDIGDIIGFPLTERIETGNAEEVIREIKKQGAFVCLPHPYHEHNLFQIHNEHFVKNIDFVEIYNCRVLNKKLNQYAEEYCCKFNKKSIIGTDAHLKRELGNAHFKLENNFVLKEEYRRESSRRNIRLSSLIKAVKTRRYSRILPLVVLYVIGK
jgi:predicted metal-dependent phosphoesterase TrpH